MGTALITGGTSGIGAAYARVLAERGDDLVLVARNRERLDREAAALRSRYGARVDVLPADLAVRSEVTRVMERLESATEPIDTFVNNAGFGLHADLLTTDTTENERAFDVMCRAVYLLGGAAARAMLARGRGEILNTSSSSAFITNGNYSAIKAWVLVYSEALATQLHGTDVHVTAFCPGWIHTEFHDRAGIDASKLPPMVWIDADRSVREALSYVARGKVVCVPSPQWKVAIAISRVLPRATIRWISGKLSRSRGPHPGTLAAPAAASGTDPDGPAGPRS